MQQICPRCGEETEGYGPRGLCQDCFRDEEELVDLPGEITVTRCPHCGRVKVGMNWREVESDQELVAAVINHAVGDEDKLRAATFEKQDGDFLVSVVVAADVDGDEMQQQLETRLVVSEETQCPPCAKFHGGYYRYVLQLRGDDVDTALEAMMEKAAVLTEHDREDFVADVSEQDGGYDVYVSSRDMAEALLKVLRGQYDVDETRSKELVGVADGQRQYRSVVSVRLSEA